jgi:phage repressor protein C with HTH and peptisase S24 domain
MLTHTQVWAAIDALAKQQGLSASGLAKKAGLDATCFNKSKRVKANGKPRWPSIEIIAKVLQACNKDARYFAALATTTQPTIPVIGLGQAGIEGFWNLDSGYPAGQGWDEFSLQELLKNNRLYAVEVSGDSMAPLYRDGDIVVVDPDQKVRRNDRVVVKLKAGDVLIKILVSQSAKQVTLRSLNPNYPDRTEARTNIAFMHRIVLASQ